MALPLIPIAVTALRSGLQAAGSVVKGSQLNAEVRRHAPTGSGW
jgi:hypothetical protein